MIDLSPLNYHIYASNVTSALQRNFMIQVSKIGYGHRFWSEIGEYPLEVVDGSNENLLLPQERRSTLFRCHGTGLVDSVFKKNLEWFSVCDEESVDCD